MPSGAVLEQVSAPMGFLRKELVPAELRYTSFSKDLRALLREPEKWRHLLLAADVTIYFDHQALQNLNKLKTDKPLKGRLARWLDFLADFVSLKVAYEPGQNNLIAEALSRCPVYYASAATTPRL